MSKFNQTSQNKFKMNSRILNDEDMKQSMMSTAIAGSKISKLQDTGVLFAAKIKQESERLIKLDAEISQNEKLLAIKRREIIYQKLQKSNKDPIILGKKLKQVQNNLEKQNIKFNETLAQNKLLREDINNLRQEKNIYKKIYKDLTKELEKKEQLKFIIQQKSDQTEQDIHQTKSLLDEAQVKAAKEKIEFDNEFYNAYHVTNITQKDENLKKMKASNIENQQDNQFTGKFVGEETYMTQVNQKDALQQDLAQQSQERKSIVASYQKDLNSLENIKQEVQKYQETFEQLQKETGKQTIEEIVQTFIDQEENNYSLFKYINGLSEELEKLDLEKKKIVENIESLKEDSDEDKKKDPKESKVQEMKAEIAQSRNKQDQLQKIQNNIIKQISDLKEGLPEIFQVLGCDTPQYLCQGINNLDLNEINEGNILQFLTVIEQRTNEIVTNHYVSHKDKQNKYGQDLPESVHTHSVESQVYYNGESNNHKDFQFRDIIEVLEEERVVSKTTNTFQAHNHKILEQNEFVKFAENEVEQEKSKKLLKIQSKK